MTALNPEVAGDLLCEGRVDEDAAVAYGYATNDRNELYERGDVVPPVFTATLVLPALQQASQEAGELTEIIGPRFGVHGEHDIFYRGVVRPGMALRWESGVHGVKQSKAGVLVTVRIVVSDTEGTPLVEHYWSNYHPNSRVTEELGEATPDHTFPEDARSRPVATATVPVDRDQTYRYAGVSGDHAPHAMSDDAARAEGRPSKILQGMCTFALCSGAVVRAVAGGDPRRLRRFAGRFAAPAYPKHDITVHLYDAGRADDGSRALAFEAVQHGVTVMKHGRVELLPD